MVVITLYLSAEAGVNAGLITSIWSITPFCFSVAERVIYGTKMKAYQFVGMFMIMMCAILLSLSSVIYPPDISNTKTTLNVHKLPAYVPVIFGVLTPVFFTLFGMTQKHMTSERVGFDPSFISNSAVFSVNVIILVVAIFYWSGAHFQYKLFICGFVGSVFDTLGKVTSLNALAYGPGGPSTALVTLSGPYLVLAVALVS